MNKIITFGEVMLRLASPGYERFGQSPVLSATFGGGEANVAVALANFGMDVSYITRLPDNDIARACVRELRGFGVDTSRILYGGKRMGIYFLEAGSVNRASKVIYDRDHSAIAEIKPGMIDWDQVFDGFSWFHWTGITPAISQGAADVCLEAIKAANARKMTVSTDLNFRKNLWKYGKTAGEVMPPLVEGCDIILGNEEDADMVLGIRPEGVEVTQGQCGGRSLFICCQADHEKISVLAKKVITTLRGSINANHNTWSGVLYDGKKLFTAPVYQITHIVDRVGGGDSVSWADLFMDC